MQKPAEKARPTGPLLSLAEAAAYLGLAEQTLYQWRFKGVGPVAVKIGGRVKYRQESLDAWIEQAAQAEADRVAQITR
jgi:excisionase family DNA binding protein